MTPDESLKAFRASFSGTHLAVILIDCLWALHVLDVWRARDGEARSWGMAEDEGVKLDACVVHHVDRSDMRFITRFFPGTSPDAARLAAARAVANEEPEILVGV